MKIKLDENLPMELGDLLSQLGHEVDTVQNEGLRGQPDSRVGQAATAAGRFLITQDLDFSDLRASSRGHIRVCCSCDCARQRGAGCSNGWAQR